jgi:hypothetical protein
MKVRLAHRIDHQQIVDCLRHFADFQPFEKIQKEAPEYNEHHIFKILDMISKAGIILVAQENNKIVGVMMGMIAPNLWLPNVKVLNEIVWWVEPEYRHTSAGARLYKEYVKQGEKLIERGDITSMSLALLSNSPKMNLTNKGWQPIETHYAYVGV